MTVVSPAFASTSIATRSPSSTARSTGSQVALRLLEPRHHGLDLLVRHLGRRRLDLQRLVVAKLDLRLHRYRRLHLQRLRADDLQRSAARPSPALAA